MGQKKLSKEEYQEELNKVQANLNLDNETLKNFHANNKLNVQHYDYVEGEFYAYRQFAIVLIIPINDENYTWKENDKYYHFTAGIKDDSKKLSEITKEQFDNYMLAGKQTLLNRISESYNLNMKLLDNSDETYLNKENTYTKSGSSLTFKCKAEQYYGEELQKVNITINYKDYLPTKMVIKGSSTDEWTYKYGSASWNVPDHVRELMK